MYEVTRNEGGVDPSDRSAESDRVAGLINALPVRPLRKVGSRLVSVEEDGVRAGRDDDRVAAVAPRCCEVDAVTGERVERRGSDSGERQRAVPIRDPSADREVHRDLERP